MRMMSRTKASEAARCKQTRLCPAQLPPDQHSTWMNHTQTAPVCLSFIAFSKRTNPSPPGRSGQASKNVLPTQGRRCRVARRPGGSWLSSTARWLWGNAGTFPPARGSTQNEKFPHSLEL